MIIVVAIRENTALFNLGWIVINRIINIVLADLGN